MNYFEWGDKYKKRSLGNNGALLKLLTKWPFKLKKKKSDMLPACMQAHSSLRREGFVFLSCWVPFEQKSILR